MKVCSTEIAQGHSVAEELCMYTHGKDDQCQILMQQTSDEPLQLPSFTGSLFKLLQRPCTYTVVMSHLCTSKVPIDEFMREGLILSGGLHSTPGSFC